MIVKKASPPEESNLPHATDPQRDIPELTPAQWAVIKKASREHEEGYVPMHSLFPGTGL